MKMKIFAAIATVAAVVSGSSARADSIVLYGNSEQPPKAWLEGGAPKGFAIDASVEVLKRAGYDVTVTLLPFARAMQKATASSNAVLIADCGTKASASVAMAP